MHSRRRVHGQVGLTARVEEDADVDVKVQEFEQLKSTQKQIARLLHKCAPSQTDPVPAPRHPGPRCPVTTPPGTLSRLGVLLWLKHERVRLATLNALPSSCPPLRCQVRGGTAGRQGHGAGAGDDAVGDRRARNAPEHVALSHRRGPHPVPGQRQRQTLNPDPEPLPENLSTARYNMAPNP